MEVKSSILSVSTKSNRLFRWNGRFFVCKHHKKRPLLGAISLAGDVFYIYICISYQNRTSVWGICHAKWSQCRSASARSEHGLVRYSL